MMQETPSPHPTLPIGIYALDFSGAATPSPAGFPGNHWRGALGTTLRDLACVTGAGSCAGCMLISYQRLETWDKQRARDLHINVVEGGQLRNLDEHLTKWIA